jgi:hypothetical protein
LLQLHGILRRKVDNLQLAQMAVVTPLCSEKYEISWWNRSVENRTKKPE